MVLWFWGECWVKLSRSWNSKSFCAEVTKIELSYPPTWFTYRLLRSWRVHLLPYISVLLSIHFVAIKFHLCSKADLQTCNRVPAAMPLFAFAWIPCPAYSGTAGMIGLRLRLRPNKLVFAWGYGPTSRSSPKASIRLKKARWTAPTCLAEVLTKAEARQSVGGFIAPELCDGGLATAQFRFDTLQLAAGSFSTVLRISWKLSSNYFPHEMRWGQLFQLPYGLTIIWYPCPKGDQYDCLLEIMELSKQIINPSTLLNECASRNTNWKLIRLV